MSIATALSPLLIGVSYSKLLASLVQRRKQIIDLFVVVVSAGNIHRGSFAYTGGSTS